MSPETASFLRLINSLRIFLLILFVIGTENGKTFVYVSCGALFVQLTPKLLK